MQSVKIVDKRLQQAANKVFKKMPLMIDAIPIVNRVEKAIGNRTDMISFSIQLAIQENQPYVNIVNTIKDQATDNFSMVAEILGTNLTNEILHFGNDYKTFAK